MNIDWDSVAGFGVAGNFTGHLEQAGESPDFVAVKTKEQHAPKGVFPFYIPTSLTQLGQNPYSSKAIQLLNHAENHQIEPEVSILFEVEYEDGVVKSLLPMQAFAHNDCSIRRKGARKISEKKNWGPNSKGIASTGISLSGLNKGQELDAFQLGCYLIRDGEIHRYGITSSVKDYSYFHQTLMDWLVDKLNHQTDYGPLEDLHQHLTTAGFPKHICISIGATRYTPLGESTFLKPDDVACVVLFDPTQYSESHITNHLLQSGASLPNTSILKQSVLPPSA